MTDKISMTDMPRALRELGVEASYNLCWRAAVEGRIPAERMGRRWYVKADDLPRVADHFTATA